MWHHFRIEINDEELKDTLEKLSVAIKSIKECCFKLEDMGVLVLTKDEAASGN